MGDTQTMPSGWDCKFDECSGKYYYINHYTKTTTWEDPRLRSRIFHSTRNHPQPEYIPLQHGSPDLRRNYVYPSQTSPIPAFQMPAHMSQKNVPLQDVKPRMSPLTLKSSKVQDSSLTVLTDTDDAAAKIAAMFPTVSDTHIRLLLKKYHNREALVISALKVEKNPITTPGPFATPPPQRNIHHAPYHMTPPLGFYANSRGGSPLFRPGSGANTTYTGSPRIGDGFRSSPRPHSSPKLKLSCRYMKSIFPEADETLILETLQNNEHNIQKVSDVLKDMGFTKKDTVKVAQQKMEAKKEEKRKEEQEEEEKKEPSPQIRMKSKEEKDEIKKDLQEKYKDVAEHLISIALESVNFDENRANQILQIMIQEDTEAADNKNKQEDSSEVDTGIAASSPVVPIQNIPISQSRQSLKSLLKEKSDKEKSIYIRVIDEHDTNSQSINLINTKGQNPSYAKGANEKLLLEDYVKWQGPNLTLKKGPQGLAKGTNVHLLSQRSFQASGPNSEFRKGPKKGLAKGSIFSQLKTAIVGESRGK